MPRSFLSKSSRRFILSASVAAFVGLLNTGYGAQWLWEDVTGNWQNSANWDAGFNGVPVSANDTFLGFGNTFNGGADVGLGTYVSTNDFAGTFDLNEIGSNVYDSTFFYTQVMTIAGNAINFTGFAPRVTIESAAGLNFTTPISVTGGEIGLGGSGSGTVSFSNTTPITNLHTFDVSGSGVLNFNALVTPGTNEIALVGVDGFGAINLNSTAGTITGVNQLRVDGAGSLNIATPIQFSSALTVTGAGAGAIVLQNSTQTTGLSHITQNGTGSLTINAPITLSATTTWDGSGLGTVTLNNTLSGLSNIVKSGDSTFRFGTNQTIPLTPVPSENTWFGSLTIGGGTIRFNNNAQSGSTALRSNPVIFSGGGGILTIRRDGDDQAAGYDTSLRMGTISGAVGSVMATVSGSNTSNYDIVITAMQNGTYGGSLTLPPPTGTGGESGKLIIRGTSNQTLTGSLSINKDVVIGRGATLTLAGNGSGLGSQNQGAITLNGGSLVLDNVAVNASSRLRDPAHTTSTGMETIGGGAFTFIGNASGSSEVLGRLQLGAYASISDQTKPRSGALNISVVSNSVSAPTTLTFVGYERDSLYRYQYSTVDFSARDGNGTPMPLGDGGNNPRIHLNGIPGLAVIITPGPGDLLSSTGGTNPSVGWATVNGTDFATHASVPGVSAVFSNPWNTTFLGSTDNAVITGSASTDNTPSDYAVNTIKIAPTVASQTLNIAGSGNLGTAAVLLTGAIDYVITSSGGGGLASHGTFSSAPRFFHVAVENAKLRLEPNLAVSANSAIVKSGPGILELVNAANAALTQPVVINQGVVRATPGTSLPNGELQLRGGVLEIKDGVTFNRGIGRGVGKVNWEGIEYSNSLMTDVSTPEDRGSGGFAAFGSNAIVDLDGAVKDNYEWEEMGFVRSGHALIFGSVAADRRITMTDNISLTAAGSTLPNYNAREIRVVDNPSVTTDFARLSGVISGNVQNDFVKTGDGTLELTGLNTYLGATQVAGGTLLVNGNSQSFLHVARSGATIGGKGSMKDVKIEAGGKLAPGEEVGESSILTVENLTFEATGELRIDMGGSTVGGDGTTGYDRVNVVGTLTLDGATLVGNKLGGFNASMGQLYFIMVNDGVDAVNGQFAQGLIFAFGSQTFDVSYVANFDGTSFTGGNDVALRLVPEPSTALLLMAGGAMGLLRRRRK